MKIRANDTLHVTSVQEEPIRPGEEFDLPDPDAKKLLDRGLVTRVAAAKKARTPSNKRAPAPKNKSAS